MPIYNLECVCCGHKFRKLASAPPESRLQCPQCKEDSAEWSGKGPTARVVEVRDNGLMPKKVEQLADIDELVKERSTKPSDDGTIV